MTAAAPGVWCSMTYPQNIYMSPRQAVSRFHRLIHKYGTDRVSKGNNFKKERELLCTGVFLMATGKYNRERYWMRPGEDISPDIDVRAVRYDKEDTSYKKRDFDIQVTELESRSTDILEAVQKKMKKGLCSEKTELLVSPDSRVYGLWWMMSATSGNITL